MRKSPQPKPKGLKKPLPTPAPPVLRPGQSAAGCWIEVTEETLPEKYVDAMVWVTIEGNIEKGFFINAHIISHNGYKRWFEPRTGNIILPSKTSHYAYCVPPSK